MLWREEVTDFREGVEEVSEASEPCFSQVGFELWEGRSTGFKSGAVGRQQEKVSAAVADELARSVALLAAKVVGDPDVAGCQDGAGCQGGPEASDQPGSEGAVVVRAAYYEGGDDPIVAQPGEKGQCLPVPMRDERDKPRPRRQGSGSDVTRSCREPARNQTAATDRSEPPMQPIPRTVSPSCKTAAMRTLRSTESSKTFNTPIIEWCK